jgi:hypothetical protein
MEIKDLTDNRAKCLAEFICKHAKVWDIYDIYDYYRRMYGDYSDGTYMIDKDTRKFINKHFPTGFNLHARFNDMDAYITILQVDFNIEVYMTKKFKPEFMSLIKYIYFRVSRIYFLY